MDSKWLALLILLVISAIHGASSEPVATSELEICSKGTGPGDCTQPQGIAVDTESGAVYVADSGNHRIDAFESDGGDPTSFGEAEVQTWLAVDNYPGSPSHHDLYVSSLDYEVRKLAPDGTELDRFGGKGDGRCQLMRTIDPIAIGPGGQVDVVDSDEISSEFFVNRIVQWSPEGKCEGQIPLFKGNLYIRNFTVDGNGNFYMTVAGAGGEIRKYSPRGKLIYKVGPESTSEGLAIGPHGELFAKQSGVQASKNAAIEFLTKYSPSGKPVQRFGYESIGVVEGLAANETPDGLLYASKQFVGVRYLSIPRGPQIVREPCRARLRTLSGDSATLIAEVNPEGRATRFHFTYTDGSKSKSTPPLPLGGRADVELHEAAQTVAGLDPSTTYHCWVVAEHPGGEPRRGLEGEFKTAER